MRSILRSSRLGKLLSWQFGGFLGILAALNRRIEFIEIFKGQLKEVVLVLPGHLGLRKSLAFSRRRCGVGDFSDEICRRRLRDAIHQHTNKGSLQDNGEAKSKAKEHPFAISEPPTLLIGRKLDATEIRLELLLLIDCRIIR